MLKNWPTTQASFLVAFGHIKGPLGPKLRLFRHSALGGKNWNEEEESLFVLSDLYIFIFIYIKMYLYI